MLNVSIIGASGYTGMELIQHLVSHPYVKLQDLTVRSLAGERIAEHFPFLKVYLADQCFVSMDLDQIKEKSDLVFICLPHGHSMDIAKVLAESCQVIDLGADFRLKDQALYQQVYGLDHTAPDQLSQAVYGLSEYYREDLASAQLVANPGCFVTAALLALLPAVQAGCIDSQSIIIDSKTGVSGAGRSPKTAHLLGELGQSFYAYNPLHHRHIPEIEQELALNTDQDVQIQFAPHMLPISRGIYSTIYADLVGDCSEEEIRAIYGQAYKDEGFVHLLPAGQWPRLADVKGSNHTYLQIAIDSRTGRLLICSALDNLMKGAAGQAIQNMNIMQDWPEDLSIGQASLYP